MSKEEAINEFITKNYGRDLSYICLQHILPTKLTNNLKVIIVIIQLLVVMYISYNYWENIESIC